jgi:D-glycero-alpha-D-manno-heptose-7-phosphate kinase
MTAPAEGITSASAPVRLDFAGGWTDVPPFSATEGGAVVAAAIGLRTHARVACTGSDLRLVSEDLDDELTLPGSATPVPDGRLDLLKAALRLHPVGPCILTTRSDVPPGSGLGSSGSLDVALVAALSAARGVRLDATELAEAGCRLERDEAGIAGGKQDQFMAALGGFQQLSFSDPDVGVTPLALQPAFADELERSLVLCYTGMSRISGRTIARVIAAFERRDAGVVRALHGMKELALRMGDALLSGDLARVAELLSRNWQHQQELDPAMRTTDMHRLESAVGSAGALGGKAAGSGAGGCMFFVAPGRAAEVAEAARGAGASVLPVTWSGEGVKLC